MASTSSHRWRVHLAVTGVGLATIAVAAQPPAGPGTAAPQITGASSGLEAKDLSVARRRFEAGARTYWHSHDNGQLLYVETGRMWTQQRGEPKRELGPGGSDYTGPNVAHWHGATTQSHLIQVNVGFGGGTKWLEAVPDADYRK